MTGGAGYIGSQTCKALAAAGHTPIVYDSLSGGHRWAVRWGPFEEGDVGDLAYALPVSWRPTGRACEIRDVAIAEAPAGAAQRLTVVDDRVAAARACGAGRFLRRATSAISHAWPVSWRPTGPMR